jgi:D-alanyl-D-alanine carboxypeptidase
MALNRRASTLNKCVVLLALLLMVAVAISACGQQKEARWQGVAPTTKAMSAADAASIDQTAQAALASGNGQLPAMWIGIWDPAKGYYVGAYGEAVKGGAAATVADHSRIGSVTKTFTAVAILEQVEAGKLALSDTIAKALPALAEKYPPLAPITVEQLLSMRSGIPDHANTGIVLGPVVKDPTKVWTTDEMIAAVMAAGGLKPPGTAGYSTTNYFILGKMLEKITGKPVEDAVNAVAKQVGMLQSALQSPAETKMPDPASHGYLNDPGVQSMAQAGVTATPGQDVSDWTVSWGQAGGGMYSTIKDLELWAASGLGNTLLPKSLGDQRLVTQATPEGKYGLGMLDWGNGWIGHTGQLVGWESICAYNKDTGAVFVALVNETGSLTGALAVAGPFFPDLITTLFGL